MESPASCRVPRPFSRVCLCSSFILYFLWLFSLGSSLFSYVVLADWGLTAFSPSMIQVNTHCQLARLSGCQPGKSSPFLVPSALLSAGDGVVFEGLKVAPHRGRVWMVAMTSIFTISEFLFRVVLQTVWLHRNIEITAWFTYVEGVFVEDSHEADALGPCLLEHRFVYWSWLSALSLKGRVKLRSVKTNYLPNIMTVFKKYRYTARFGITPVIL